MSSLIKSYKNGNACVSIFSDGSRVIDCDEEKINLEYPLSVDMKVTNSCNMGCPYCHEGCVNNGKHANIENLSFLDTFLPYTEIAIGGGNILEYPDIELLLNKIRNNKLIANITLNQIHYIANYFKVDEWIKKGIVNGVGVSFTNRWLARDTDFFEMLNSMPNAVVHVINGIFSKEDYECLKDHNIKLLILGYKDFRRGHEYSAEEENNNEISENQKWLRENLKDIKDHFNCVSFDNLAVNQLPVKEIAGNYWDTIYQGDDGESTFYIDAVNEVYAINSTAPFEERYPIKDTIKEMFLDIKEKKK